MYGEKGPGKCQQFHLLRVFSLQRPGSVKAEALQGLQVLLGRKVSRKKRKCIAEQLAMLRSINLQIEVFENYDQIIC